MQETIKGCYLHYRDVIDNEKPGGIEKKVAAQIKAFNDAGLSCDFILCKQPETTMSKVLSCLPFFSDGINWPDPASMADYSFMYIRRPRFASRELIGFIKDTKQMNPRIKVVYEIPTYPYDDEMKNPLLYPALIKDRKKRMGLKACVDRIATLTDDKGIFDIEAIKIMNGIDLSRVSLKEPAPSLEEVHIVVVASFEPWHGLDRLIKGVIDYYQSKAIHRSIILHVVGAGNVLKPLIGQVNAAGLKDRIIFHGYCNSTELDMLYNQCSLAVESLGFHRIGLTVSATLKSREYLAKGIPFICANMTDVFMDNPVDFCLRIPSDETPVDVNAVLDFHDSLYSSETQEALIARVRSFAESHLGMDQAMREAIDYFLDR